MYLPKPNWHLRFIELAKLVSTWSKDPRTKVGCVIARDKHVISLGYNGFPQGVEDTPERLNDRDLKNKFVVHAEKNCIYNTNQDLTASDVYCTLMPCRECAKALIQKKVRAIMFLKTDDIETRKIEFGFDDTRILCQESGVLLLCLDPTNNTFTSFT